MKKAISFVPLLMLLFVCLGETTPQFQYSDDGLANAKFSSSDPYPTSNTTTYTNKPASRPDRDSSVYSIDGRYKNAVNRLKQQASTLKEYANANHFNSEYCFLVDMSIPSGKKRFFIYNLKKDEVEYSSLVAHGAGSSIPGTDQLLFSNTPNSYKTSLGKYKIGHSYYGTFGQAYKLYGLDTTNSRAFERAIVLHSFSYVPDSETYPGNICLSSGCQMVSRACLAILNKYIMSSTNPLLMWIYN